MIFILILTDLEVPKQLFLEKDRGHVEKVMCLQQPANESKTIICYLVEFRKKSFVFVTLSNRNNMIEYFSNRNVIDDIHHFFFNSISDFVF